MTWLILAGLALAALILLGRLTKHVINEALRSALEEDRRRWR